MIAMINKKLLKMIANKYPDIRKINKAMYTKYKIYLLITYTYFVNVAYTTSAGNV